MNSLLYSFRTRIWIPLLGSILCNYIIFVIAHSWHNYSYITASAGIVGHLCIASGCVLVRTQENDRVLRKVYLITCLLPILTIIAYLVNFVSHQGIVIEYLSLIVGDIVGIIIGLIRITK